MRFGLARLRRRQNVFTQPRPIRDIGKLLLLARLVGAGEQRRRGANGQAYLKSEAVLRIAREASALAVDMGHPLIPRVTRDAIYDLVARNRYRWFGRRNACILPIRIARGHREPP